ncbi:DUF3426 domain-containing protein [Noviherbaspirillum sp. CPCC 100848]|uniref:DUF3426 domain-containing protein n=1 Tax=Noviherbaspirillum album TaxID=3080276 RepID=A0ABU6J6S6_9BURK|nr:DUF3426 domain-containing protein [Noviherbaspirillum sp. CPCC 100848]MEC4719235.1 DUF3426 domain-containing protein [Noviherbaspirillum sp. CPCC 100848]
MALATQCPHCHTTFRVAHDQLKLRAGLVRCGACKQIFNGIENLLRPEELQAAGKPQSPARGAPATPLSSPSPAAASPVPAESPESTESAQSSRGPDGSPSPHPAQPDSSDLPDLPGSPDTLAEPAAATPEPSIAPPASIPAKEDTASPTPPEDDTGGRPDPLLRMTLMDIAHLPLRPSRDEAQPAEAETDAGHDPVEQAIDDLQSKPWRSKPEESDGADALDQADAADYEEPGFVREARRKQRMTRGLNVFMVLASALLLGILLAQAAYVFRDQIAAYFPQAQPLLAAACEHSGCQVGLPAEVDSVSIESSELQALAPDSDSFSLTLLLRNRSTTAQAWPSIELTLNDAAEKPLLRRVFGPRDYLPAGQDLNQGFAAKSEQALKLHFRLTQLKAAGYRVYVFYP